MNLNQVIIPSKNITVSILNYARFECPDGNSTFSIHLVDSLPFGSGVIIYFEIENLDKYIDELI